VGDGEAEMETVPEQRVGHGSGPFPGLIAHPRRARTQRAKLAQDSLLASSSEPRCPASGQPALRVARTPRLPSHGRCRMGEEDRPDAAPQGPSPDTGSREDRRPPDACGRPPNSPPAGKISLKKTPLLREPLRPEHIKPRLLGHWGTSPGLSLI